MLVTMFEDPFTPSQTRQDLEKKNVTKLDEQRHDLSPIGVKPNDTG